jgi:hypothetical protein
MDCSSHTNSPKTLIFRVKIFDKRKENIKKDAKVNQVKRSLLKISSAIEKSANINSDNEDGICIFNQ